MIFLQIVVCIIIPVVMVAVGHTINKKRFNFDSEGISYRTKTARRSEQTWEFANTIFSKICFFTGINLIVTSVAFFLAAVLAAGAKGWQLSVLIFIIQFLCAFSPVLVTEIFLRKTFDENGELISCNSEEANNN